MLANYQAVTNQAQQVAATPYSAYGGELVSPVNAQQNTGIGAVNSASGIQNPYNDVAGGLAGASASTIDPTTVNAADISQYESPYQSDVVNATEAEIQNQNQQQAASLQGNSISSGSFGGDRAGVAQAALAGQQDIAENATLADLNNQNYSQALGEANTQQTVGLGAAQNTAARQLAASQQIGTLGTTAQTEALNEANAQTNAGTLEQTTQQAQDTAAYNQFLQQQAYPFQTTGWLANIVEGIGSQEGGSSTGTTQQQSSIGSQAAGAALGLASFLKRGGRVPHRASGGGLGGGVYAPTMFDPTALAGPTGLGGGTYVPQANLAVGHTMPTSSGAQSPNNSQSAAQSPQQQGQSMAQTAKAVQTLGTAAQGAWNNPTYGGGNALTGDVSGGSSAAPLDGLSADDYGAGFKRGGLVGYDDGGTVTDQPDTFVVPDASAPIDNVPLPTPRPADAPTGLAAPADQAPVATGGLNPQARGMRNNNPGNLIDNAWTQSLPGYTGSDGHFAQFDTQQNGTAALDRNLQSYQSKGVSTPFQIASRWAPAGDGSNNPTAYAGVIAKTLGVGINDPIDLADPAQRSKVGSAISLVENGHAPSGVAGGSALNFDNEQPQAQSPGLAAISHAMQNGSGTGGNQTSMPQFPDNTPTPASGRSGLFGLNLSPETRQLMLSAGLGIMGGTSRSALTNIGQGGLAGIAAVNQNKSASAEVGLKNAQAQSVQTETALKQQQLKLMLKALDNNQKIFEGQQSGASPSASAPAATAPTAAASAAPAAPVAQAPDVAPQYDPVRLRAAAENMSFVNPAVAANYRDQAEAIESGRAQVQFKDGHWGYFNPQAGIDLAAQKSAADAKAKLPYETTESQPVPGGPTKTISKAQALGVGTGAGSPPGSAADNTAASDPTIAKQPEFYAKRQEQIATNENSMIEQMQARQLSRQRLQALSGIIQNFQPGAFAGEKADLVAGLRGVGIPVPDSATANPAAFQEFTKNAVANVFNDVKSQGGRVLVSEITGLTKANANPELQPAAAAAIIGQGMGVLDYEDKHTQDYFDWKHQNPNAYDTSSFELPWLKSHPVSDFVSNATKGIPYSGQEIPTSDKRVVGQSYQTPKGPAIWRGTGWQLAPAAQ